MHMVQNRLFRRTPSEHATVRCIHYGLLGVILLSIGLLNNSVGLYLGVYLLCSSLVSNLMWVLSLSIHLNRF